MSDFQIPPSKWEALEEVHREHLIRVNHQNPEPPVLGEGLLRKLDFLLLKMEHAVQKWLPEDLNPFSQTGAIANASLLICLISGILMLFWYSTSVHTAYSSLKAIENVWYAQLVRSLHRYSADVAMFFVLFHAFQIFVARRFSGPRWIAWVTGVILLFLLWLDGWTGYWLIWDERGQHVAVYTAKILDTLPIFAEPISRSFLTNSSVNSLLFFLVFFLHMLIPLAMILAIWLHIIRLNRPYFFPSKRMWWLLVLVFTVLSLIWPATSAAPADMQRILQQYPTDIFYLFPLYLEHWLEGGLLWLAVFLFTLAFLTVPWWMTRRHREAAYVLESRCNGCGQCYKDCPYSAITLIPTPDKKWEQLAEVDPDKCVGCGVCVGACNPGAIIFPKLPVQNVREKIDRWLTQAVEEEKAKYIAFLCANSAGSDLEIHPETGLSPQLPGYRIIPVPCSSWVHPILIERTLKKGAQGVLIVGCGPDPMYRVGTEWTELRLKGDRPPALREEKLRGKKVRFLRYDRASRAEFLKVARQFLEEEEEAVQVSSPPRPKWLGYTVAFLTLSLFTLLSMAGSYVPFRAYASSKAELVISFHHAGEFRKAKQKVAPKKQENLLPHMRRPQGRVAGRRERVPVRLQVWIDNRKVLEKAYRPSGLFRDGASVGLEVIPIEPGKHTVKILIGDKADPKVWTFQKSFSLEFPEHYRRVILFDKVSGFRVF